MPQSRAFWIMASSFSGPEGKGLEERMAEYCGTRFAVGCASGPAITSLLAMMALSGWGTGTAVVITPFTFFATAGSIHQLGATPVISSTSIRPPFNMDPVLLDDALKAGRQSKT